VQLHELAHIVQHIVVLGRSRRHLLDDGGNVTKDRGIQQSCISLRFFKWRERETKFGEDLPDEMVLILGQLRLVLTPFGQFFFALHIGHLAKNQSMSEIVGEHQIACKAIRKCRIEIEDFEQFITFDGMQITIGQSTHIGRTLANGRVLPELIAEDVALACKESDLSVEYGSIKGRRSIADLYRLSLVTFLKHITDTIFL